MRLPNKRRADIILIVVLLVVASAVWFFMQSQRQEGGLAVVTVAGEELMRLPLDSLYEGVIGEGDHTNTLVIKNGRAHVTEASCPDHVCINMGEIQYEGETIVCLPNKLVVSIEGGENKGSDAISQ